MPLPILNTPDSQTLLRYFHQTERHWTQHLAEATELDIGLAFANPALGPTIDRNAVYAGAWVEIPDAPYYQHVP